MGIRGLKTFIENNSDLLRSYRLHDTHIVIDGNNLIYCLYWRSSHSSKDYIYGGDYCRYATTVQQFFKTLEKCNIRPIVVLDGGIDPSQMKVKTINERYKKSLEEAKLISKYNMTNEKVIPTLAKPVFISIMTQMNVQHIQASYEADSCIARIANQLKCPVLSNDSDFFVYDLNCGVISIDSVDHTWLIRTANCETDTTNDNECQYQYIDCNLYQIDNLIEYFPGLHRDIMPLFSTLMGNDYVDAKVFDNIFNAIPNVSSNSRNKSKSLHIGKRHLRIAKLLNWLRYKTVDEAVQFLINFLNKNARNNALNLLQLSLENYSEGICDSDLFEKKFETTFDANCVASLSSFMLKRDDSLPQWFIDEFHKTLLSSTFVNVIKMKCDVLSPRIEDFSLLSSYSCTLELRKFMYGMLRLNEELEPITVYDREKSHFAKTKTYPYLSAPNHESLPNLYELRNLTINQRKDLLLSILSIDNVFLEKTKNIFLLTDGHIDIDGAVFLIVVMKYWLENSSNSIWSEFIYSLLTSIMFCGHMGSFNKIKFVLFEKQTIKEIVDNLSKFNCRPIHNCGKVFQSRIVHYFSEFQNCIQIIRHVYSLFDYPFKLGEPFFCLNGTFIYNLTVELSSRKNPVLYLSQIFGRNSFATTLFEKLLETVFDGIDQNKFVRCLEVSNRKSHIESQKLKSKKNKSSKLGNRFSDLKIE